MSLLLADKGLEQLRQILNYTLRDAFYTILLGLDGGANIGNHQTTYKILDEQNNELTGVEIKSFAYEYFYNNKLEIDKNEVDFIATLAYRKIEEGLYINFYKADAH